MGDGPSYKYSYDMSKSHAQQVCAAAADVFLIQPAYYDVLKVFANTPTAVPHLMYEIYATQLCRLVNRRRRRLPFPCWQRLKDLLRNFSPKNPLRTYYEGLLQSIRALTKSGHVLLEDLDYNDSEFAIIWEDLCAHELCLPRTLAASPQLTPPPSVSGEFQDEYFVVEHAHDPLYRSLNIL